MKRLIGRASKLAALGLLTVGFTAQATTPEAVPGEFIVKFKDSAVMRSSLNVLGQELGAYVKDTIPNLNIVVIKRPVFEIESDVVKNFSQHPDVEIFEPNYIYRMNRQPNDPAYLSLWGMNNAGQKDSQGKVGVTGFDIRAEQAWDITTGSKDVIVAVIDTGIDYNHPDLKPNLWTNAAELNGLPGVDDDGNGIVDDIYGANFVNATKPTGNPLDDQGHGTHCSGTIGAAGNDGVGVAGVAWNVRLMAVKFLSASGGGSLDGALKSIDYATSMGAKVLSNSWGGGGASETLKQAIQRSHAAGTIFVAAAGNDGSNNDASPSYPASYDVPNVLSVAAMDNQGKLASFSNYGRKSVHVGAPGVNIYSTMKGGKYDSLSGTSMATPHVSGAAALLAAKEPKMDGVAMKNRIMTTARPVDGLRGKSTNGMLDVYAMLTNQPAPPDMSDPANWKTIPVNVSSQHPYGNNASEIYEVRVAGVKEFALFFERFDTERTYDKVEFFDVNGKLVGAMHGMNDASFSPTISGDYVKIKFTSDKTGTRYGFDITKAAWR